MSARDTQLLEFITKGFKAVKVTSLLGGDESVFMGKGIVARILPIGAITVTPRDDTEELWDAITSAGIDLTGSPIAINTEFILDFSAAGDCFVVYKV